MPPDLGPSPHQRPRAPLLALLAGGVVAGFGVGALVLALLLPAPTVAPLPPLPENLSAQSGTASLPAVRSWPEAFGTPPEPEPVAPVEWEPPPDAPPEDAEEPEYPPYEDHDYRLRGMVAQAAEAGDARENGGWALIESEIGIEVVRVGSELSGGETIIEITPHGVILQGYGAEFLLSFSDADGYDDNGRFDSFNDSDTDDDDPYSPRFGP